MKTKAIIPAFLLLGLSAGCSSSSDPQPATPTPTAPVQSSITVKVSEAGAPSYDLSEARVVNANYQTGATSLTIAGKLASGKALTLRFTRSGNAADYTTNVLAATLDGTAASPTTGTTAFNTQTRTVDGAFQATFPAIGELSGSFADITVQ